MTTHVSCTPVQYNGDNVREFELQVESTFPLWLVLHMLTDLSRHAIHALHAISSIITWSTTLTVTIIPVTFQSTKSTVIVIFISIITLTASIAESIKALKQGSRVCMSIHLSICHIALYRMMHYSTKRGLAIACHPSVCNVGGSWPHRLKIMETNYLNNQPNIFAHRSPKIIHLLPGEHGEILGRKCSFNTYVHNVWLNWVKFNRESRDLRWRCGCWLFVYFCHGIAR